MRTCGPGSRNPLFVRLSTQYQENPFWNDHNPARHSNRIAYGVASFMEPAGGHTGAALRQLEESLPLAAESENGSHYQFPFPTA
jgi:hypothetical protein